MWRGVVVERGYRIPLRSEGGGFRGSQGKVFARMNGNREYRGGEISYIAPGLGTEGDSCVQDIGISFDA